MRTFRDLASTRGTSMDQRSAARHRILRAATIEFGGSTIPCMVRNMSDAGARLRSIAENSASPMLEVVILDAAYALPLVVERVEPPWRHAVERSVQDHCDISDKPEIRRDAFS